MDMSAVTRFEVINHTQDASVTYAPSAPLSVVGNSVSVELVLQDEGRTLKVFLRDLDG